MAFHNMRSVWKKHADDVRYPYLRMEVVWPSFVSMGNPNFPKAVQLIREIAARKDDAADAPALPAISTAEQANACLIDLTRHLELSTRKILADFFRDSLPAVSAPWIEYPYLDKVTTLQVLHSAHRFIVETMAQQTTHDPQRQAAIVRLGKTMEFVKQRHLGEITLSCIHLARTKQVPCRRESEMLPLFVFGHGSRQKRLFQGFWGRRAILAWRPPPTSQSPMMSWR